METLPVPDTIPVMTLPRVVFFPQALLPLHIFEARYREMLRDVLAGNRVFAVARLDPNQPVRPGAREPLHRVATVGVIRACQKADKNASNLLLEGVTRVEVSAIVRERPYRIIAVRPLSCTTGGDPARMEDMRLEVMRLLGLRRRLGTPAPKGMTRFLESIEDFDAFADVAAFNLCDNDEVKQRMLEELDTSRRLQMFARQLRSEIATQRLRRKLQGPLPDDGIINN